MSACHGVDDRGHFAPEAVERAAQLAEDLFLPCCEHCERPCYAQSFDGHLVPCRHCIVLLNATHGDGCQESAQRLWQVMVGDSAEELSGMHRERLGGGNVLRNASDKGHARGAR